MRSSISEILPPWSTRIRPYPPGKPVEEVERELGRTAIKLASNENPLGPSPKAQEAIRNYLDRVPRQPGARDSGKRRGRQHLRCVRLLRHLPPWDEGLMEPKSGWPSFPL